jgi:3-hydroxybutyryl-CoA dehydrogenase
MIGHVAIIGAGLMGHGLAVVFAEGGHKVTITDPVAEALSTVKDRVRATLSSKPRPKNCR